MAAALAAHDLDRPFHRECLPVGTVAGEGVEAVRDRGNLALERDRAAHELPRITRAVPLLMVREGDRRAQLQQRAARAREDLVADPGMALHLFALLGSQGARAQQD